MSRVLLHPAAILSALCSISSPALTETFQSPHPLSEWGVSGASAIAVSPEGNILVATGNGTIARFVPTGELVSEWEPRVGGKFHSAVGIAVDPSGLVYVTEYWGNRVRVFKEHGEYVRGWGDKGTGAGQFDGPSGIAIGKDGLVYVADRGNHRIQVFSSDGHYRSAWRGRSGGRLDDPVAVAVDGHRIYVGDGSEGSIKIFTME